MTSFLAGCMSTAPIHWKHPKHPSSQWSSDHQRCKRATDKYLGKQTRYQADLDIGTGDSYAEQMRVYEVAKKQKKLVAECMYKRGYFPMK